MKIGLILECTTDGPDWQDYSGWVTRILGNNVVVEQSSATNKKQLIQQAGARALALLAEGCDKVFFIWDLWPAWGAKGTPPSQVADEVALQQSLAAAGVTDPCVYFLCVNRMLETLLLVDGSALGTVLQIPLGRKTPGNNNKPYTQVAPKTYLDNWFRKAKKGAYLDYVHAVQIARQVNFARLRAKTNEFPRLEDGLQQTPCAPPLAWTP